jgi:hypothetical protein
VLAAAAGAVRGLPDHHFLDRLVRSRWWIPVLGVILTGVVAVQVEVLKYGASFGRNINLAGSLQSANQLLRLDISRLSDPERIERLAAGDGMVMVGPTNVDFAAARRPGAVGRAIHSIKPPDTQGFMSALAAQGSPSGSMTQAVGTAPAGTVLASTTAPAAGASSSTTSPAASSAQQTSTAPATTTGTEPTAATTGTAATAGTAATTGTAATAGTTPAAGTSPTPGTDATSASTTASPVSTPTAPATGAANSATVSPGYTGAPSATATTTAAATANGGAALPAG